MIQKISPLYMEHTPLLQQPQQFCTGPCLG